MLAQLIALQVIFYTTPTDRNRRNPCLLVIHRHKQARSVQRSAMPTDAVTSHDFLLIVPAIHYNPDAPTIFDASDLTITRTSQKLY
jgi:hypothetical protein